MDCLIDPKKLNGEMKVPPSKSIAHRAVICAALSDGISRISNIDYSDDILATMEAMKSFGAKMTKNEDVLEVVGIYATGQLDRKRNIDEVLIDCNESGSTLRFVVPISTLFPGSIALSAEENWDKDRFIHIIIFLMSKGFNTVTKKVNWTYGLRAS